MVLITHESTNLTLVFNKILMKNATLINLRGIYAMLAHFGSTILQKFVIVDAADAIDGHFLQQWNDPR